MPYNPSGKFIMNPEAPVFLSGRGGHGPHPAATTRDPCDRVFYGVPQPEQSQVPAPPTNTPKIATPPSKIQLFGSGHGMFFDPSPGMFTGDGAPRKSPYRADGTLPSAPDLESDVLTHQQYPEPAENQLHILSKRECTKRMANFGKKGPIQRIRVGGPIPQGNQQWTRVMVQEKEKGSVPLGRRVHKADEMQGEGSASSRPVYITDEMESNLLQLMGITGEEEEKDLGSERER